MSSVVNEDENAPKSVSLLYLLGHINWFLCCNDAVQGLFTCQTLLPNVASKLARDARYEEVA